MHIYTQQSEPIIFVQFNEFFGQQHLFCPLYWEEMCMDMCVNLTGMCVDLMACLFVYESVYRLVYIHIHRPVSTHVSLDMFMDECIYTCMHVCDALFIFVHGDICTEMLTRHLMQRSPSAQHIDPYEIFE